MTRYHVELDLTCPSNWIDSDVRKYIERITPTREERESIKITSLEEPSLVEQICGPICPACGLPKMNCDCMPEKKK